MIPSNQLRIHEFKHTENSTSPERIPNLPYINSIPHSPLFHTTLPPTRTHNRPPPPSPTRCPITSSTLHRTLFPSLAFSPLPICNYPLTEPTSHRLLFASIISFLPSQKKEEGRGDVLVYTCYFAGCSVTALGRGGLVMGGAGR